MKKTLALIAVLSLGCICGPATAHAEIMFGGPNNTLDTEGLGGWGMDGTYLQDWRTALENPTNFGPGGTVSTSIATQSLAAINPTTLAGIDVFVSPWWADVDSAPYVTDVVNFFLGGGTLFLLQDDLNHDAIGAALGISSFTSSSNPHTGTAPFYDGAFGSVTSITQTGTQGYLNATDVASNGGTAASFDANGLVTGAYWNPGDYASGAGALVILSDIDMISTFGAANYGTLNNNARFALNVSAFLATNAATVPEPTSLAIWTVLGSLSCCVIRRRKS